MRFAFVVTCAFITMWCVITMLRKIHFKKVDLVILTLLYCIILKPEQKALWGTLTLLSWFGFNFSFPVFSPFTLNNHSQLNNSTASP